MRLYRFLSLNSYLFTFKGELFQNKLKKIEIVSLSRRLLILDIFVKAVTVVFCYFVPSHSTFEASLMLWMAILHNVKFL